MTLAKSAALKIYSEDSQRGLDLLEGWAFPKIGEILAVNYGKGLKKAKRVPGPVSVYGSNGVVGKHNIPLTHGPTILLGRKGTVGAVHFSKVPCWPIDTTYFIDDFNGLVPRYLVYALRRINLSQLDTSTAIPGLNRDELYSQYVPLAPIAEQKRIVAKVEQLLARVNSARERLAKVPEILKRFRQSVLAAACSGRLTADWRDTHQEIKPASKLLEQIISRSPQRRSAGLTNGVRINDDLPETWTHCRLGLLSKLITKGASPKWQGIDYASKGILFITSENVRSGYLNLENRKYVEKRFNAIQKRSILEKGDLLTNIVGASIGRTAIFDLDDVANINQAVALIRLCSDVDKRYILNVLNAPMILDFMNENKVDVARANLSLKDVLNFPVPLPPMAEQREIVHRTEGLFQIATQIEARYERATAYVEKLTQSILAKAFRGELVHTEAELAQLEGRPYEHASVLLAKIEAQKKGVKPHRKRGRSWQKFR